MEAAQAHLGLHLLKCHIVGNHVSRLKLDVILSLNILTVLVNSADTREMLK